MTTNAVKLMIWCYVELKEEKDSKGTAADLVCMQCEAEAVMIQRRMTILDYIKGRNFESDAADLLKQMELKTNPVEWEIIEAISYIFGR